MPKIKIEVGSLSFSTKTAAIEHFRQMLYRYGLNERVSEQDAMELRCLLDRHSERGQKVGESCETHDQQD
ncbi:MAG TPA: DUF3223 domain-containing protein [Steroidobacteraceae bacterium]|jgi:hypothetical protein|nr:DUF3223 domain-containing protein [Steroidobacteraceae bacterium]